MELTTIKKSIYEIRGKNVMLDMDLAKLYDVETKALKQAVRRNIDRFPGLYVSIDKRRMDNSKVTDCDLRSRERESPQVFTFYLHRTRGCDAQCSIEFSTSNSSKHSNHARICHDSTMGIHAPGTFREVDSA